ncbi:hypothetical protein B0T26DRAFT_744794 [Lasiosphaeria miniovina]|uniref:Uncharacterized protein n=1 Tax=Lasiosphaeria miniovina TaxID=1954250 RepID=A0AA39ZQK3_9PEZI|nr:uncharacterized protein B0T26DRAFT_744794 [Lasiosphaeria miniovina]KAK0701783.1 hypothetical protein B0T26DRAFT_744794 [Lasiosphaeria miniovina]
MQDVTFQDYIRNLQTIIVPALIVEDDTTKRSSGSVTDVHSKVYPRTVRRWDEFPLLCEKQFDDMAKKNLSPNSRKDEKDIVPFIRAYAERPAMVIVNKFAATHKLLQGTELQFHNNAYGLHPKLVQGDGKSLPPPNKKRSPDRPTSLAPDRWAVHITQKTNIETTALVEYRYAASGECMVFLTIPFNTPDVLLIHLCDKSPTDMPSLSQSHAVQLATLGLLALKADIPPAQWILNAEQTLPRWPSPKERKDNQPGAGVAITGDAAPSLPPPLPDDTPASCRSIIKGKWDECDDDEDTNDNRPTAAMAKRKREEPRPTALPSSHNNGGGGKSSSHQRGGPDTEQYCTQACLLGLRRKGPLDPNCPNTPVHSSKQGYLSHRPISASELCLRVRDRLSRNLDDGCECLDKYGMFGATGVLFELTDPTADANTLTDEAWIYSHCLDFQGIWIPVYLGNIELVYHYPLRSAAAATHMMLLSWAGTTLCHRPPPAGDHGDRFSPLFRVCRA